MRCDRGYTHQLPDLAVWLKDSKPPGAVIAESGGRREDRQKMILEGWRDALWSGRYIAVRYDCASPSVAHWINRLARKVGLTGSAFMATVQTTPEEIAALSPTPLDDEPAFDEPESVAASEQVPDQEPQVAHVPAPAPPVPPREPPPMADLETPAAAARRERAYREIFGIEDPKPRRRWRR